MRQDQFEKLQALTEKLTDVFLGEADPDKWPGHGIEASSWDQQTRGDRYWMKKNAAATLTVVMKTTNLIGLIQQRSSAGESGGVAVPEGNPELDSLDAEIQAAEREAAKLLSQIQQGTAKAAFDKRVHGKA
ncbi:MAG TPA: hypothetical protein VNS29_15185 [Burkholderiaceae bacterium]|nr:hypothetical protein [Burkholderiaceae bacterium]